MSSSQCLFDARVAPGPSDVPQARSLGPHGGQDRPTSLRRWPIARGRARTIPRWLCPVVLSGALGAGASGCAATGEPEESVPILVDITLSDVGPSILVPGTRIDLEGSSFLPEFVGPSTLRLTGTFAGSAVDLALPATFEDYDRMSVRWPGAVVFDAGTDDGWFEGQAIVETTSSYDGLVHQSPAVAVTLEAHPQLAPTLESVDNQVLFVNDPVVVHGSGLLLGGDEGESIAIVDGCFTPSGQSTCEPLATTEITVLPLDPWDRSGGQFAFSPRIAGILPGTFTGSVRIQNRHGGLAGGAIADSASVPTQNDLIEPVVFSFTPEGASLGQYVDVAGGGFVGREANYPETASAVTTLELDGTFQRDGAPSPTPVSLLLVPEFVDGGLVRYVVNEEDQLGQSLDLRSETGTFDGTARPVVSYGADDVTGSATAVTLRIEPVRQVVWVHFLPAYVESLRHFGLRAADQLIRSRVLEVTRRDYAGTNMDWRTEPPTDFALYSWVEIGGPDPNGLGLIGYDNTTGKDNGNIRLHDKIGGVNALTQEDGYPGYGGVFVDSLFTFSFHPGAYVPQAEAPDAFFDQLFDSFRPDVGNVPVTAGELGSGVVPTLTSGAACPAGDRPTQIACAIWALGSVIGSTTSHEVGHSIGLADPWGSAIHNSGDNPNALMDSGSNRPFAERAEILGQGPGMFCVSQFQYLQQILPTSEPDPLPNRIECY